jgi:hypothetical protein
MKATLSAMLTRAQGRGRAAKGLTGVVERAVVLEQHHLAV